ncbi:MAG: DUF3078 domain-containing protein [bacterium]|nr:DUF3078 domain-containing protein [bacterium]
MKNQLLLTTAILITCTGAFAQVTDAEKNLRAIEVDTVNGWKKGGLITFNISQASFSDWAGGGQNSINFSGTFNAFANYIHNKSRWDNMLNVGYGMLRQGTQNGFIKTDDKLEFNTKYGRAAGHGWYYAALANFKSQMAAGYNYPNDSVIISKFMAPGYLILALGMDYKPNEHFSAFISPITSKNTFVQDQRLADAGAFGVQAATYDTSGVLIKHGLQRRTEFGGYVRIMFRQTFFEDKSVTLLTKLDLFSNYAHNPQNIDVNWETLISLKVNKLITASLGVTIVYDDDIKLPVDRNGDGVKESTGPRTQLKEILAIGIAYKF